MHIKIQEPGNTHLNKELINWLSEQTFKAPAVCVSHYWVTTVVKAQIHMFMLNMKGIKHWYIHITTFLTLLNKDDACKCIFSDLARVSCLIPTLAFCRCLTGERSDWEPRVRVMRAGTKGERSGAVHQMSGWWSGPNTCERRSSILLTMTWTSAER